MSPLVPFETIASFFIGSVVVALVACRLVGLRPSRPPALRESVAGTFLLAPICVLHGYLVFSSLYAGSIHRLRAPGYWLVQSSPQGFWLTFGILYLIFLFCLFAFFHQLHALLRSRKSAA